MARPAAGLRQCGNAGRQPLTQLRRGAAVAAVAVLLATGAAPAQQGLALSGGGARALAHAGAVAGLEARGYDPGIIAGTSMGAIIGALYAAGYRADAIVALVRSENWREVFAPVPRPVGPDREWRRPQLAIGRGRAPFTLEGLLDAPRIDRTLIRLLFDAGVRARNDFDSLPRRFRAVAADLADGAVLPIGAGDLPRAVRASMAVPGVFSPVPWGDRVLVDGGIADNLPVAVARAMGAATVVAVDVLRPREPAGGNPLDIAVRALRLTLLNAVPDGPPPDVLVLPPLSSGFNEVLFPRDASRLIDAGRAAALEAPPAGTPEPGARPPAPAPDSLHAVEIESPDPRLAALARAAFGGLAPAPYRPDAVFAATDRLLAAWPVRVVWPRVERRAGRNVLVALVLPEPDLEAAAAAGWSLDRGAGLWLDARARMSGPWAPTASAAGAADALGRWATLSLRLQPPALLPVSVSTGASARRTELRLFDGPDITGEAFVDRFGGWLGAEWQRIGPDAGAVALLRAEHVTIDGQDAGWSIGPLVRIDLTGAASRPVGEPAVFEAELRRGDVAYHRLRAAASIPLRAGRLRAAIIGDLATASDDAPPDALPDLGGPHGLPGIRRQRFRAPARAIAGIDLAWPILLEGDLRLRLRSGATAAAPDDLAHARWIGAAGIGAAWWSVAGSLTVELGVTTRGDERLEIAIGHAF